MDEAIAFVQKFKITEIEDIHVLFADRTGNSAVIGVYDGQLQIHRRQGNHQLLTNFNLSNPSYGDEPPCTRFATATNLLAQDSTVTVSNLEKILSQTHQSDLTAYSNIYDLSRREVYVYVHARFRKRVKFNLAEELRKGKHTLRLEKLF